MELIKVENYDELSSLASAIVLESIKESSKINLGLATGSTPIGLYEKLIEDYRKNKTNYEHVKTFNLDEYLNLNPTNPNSYHYFMDKHLFSHIPIPKNNIHIPNGMTENIEEECKRYEELIKTSGGIDLQILGIGGNGHIGFNEPGSKFSSKTRLIELAESTIKANSRFFSNIEEVPKFAITMGVDTIFQAKKIILLVSGKNKAQTMKELLNGDISENFTASILKKHPNTIVIADEDSLNFS